MRVGGFGCPTLAPALYPVRAFPWGAGALLRGNRANSPVFAIFFLPRYHAAW